MEWGFLFLLCLLTSFPFFVFFGDFIGAFFILFELGFVFYSIFNIEKLILTRNIFPLNPLGSQIKNQFLNCENIWDVYCITYPGCELGGWKSQFGRGLIVVNQSLLSVCSESEIKMLLRCVMNQVTKGGLRNFYAFLALTLLKKIPNKNWKFFGGNFCFPNKKNMENSGVFSTIIFFLFFPWVYAILKFAKPLLISEKSLNVGLDEFVAPQLHQNTLISKFSKFLFCHDTVPNPGLMILEIEESKFIHKRRFFEKSKSY